MRQVTSRGAALSGASMSEKSRAHLTPPTIQGRELSRAPRGVYFEGLVTFVRAEQVLAFVALLSVLTAACGPSHAAHEIDLTEARLDGAIEPERAIDNEHQVPSFRIETVSGDVLDSRELIGKHAFMFVYFATWCDVCRMKLPMVRFALDRYGGDIEVYGVVMDDGSTWGRVPQYVDRYDIDYALVRAESFPRFAMAYSPSGRVPAVTIVGKDGYLVDYQHGYARQHMARLVRALSIAETGGQHPAHR